MEFTPELARFDFAFFDLLREPPRPLVGFAMAEMGTWVFNNHQVLNFKS